MMSISTRVAAFQRARGSWILSGVSGDFRSKMWYLPIVHERVRNASWKLRTRSGDARMTMSNPSSRRLFLQASVWKVW